LDDVVTTPHRKNESCYEIFTDKASDMADTSLRPKQRNRDMRFCTWNFRSLYRAGSFTVAARELGRYKLDLAGVHYFRCDKGGTLLAGDYNFVY